MEYEVSIRITFPEAISRIIKQEKARFVTEYGSGYKSDPHITLYLGRYELEEFSKLLEDLKGLVLKPFAMTLLKPKIIVEEGLRRNLYVVDVSDSEQLQVLHETITPTAVRYQSPLLREKDRKRIEQGLQKDSAFNPHITLGAISFDKPQADIGVVQKNLEAVVGAEITVSSIVVFFYGKNSDEERARLLEEVQIPFQTRLGFEPRLEVET